MKHKILSLLFLCLTAGSAWAQDLIKQGSLFFTTTSATTVELAPGNYTGDVIIPETVYDDFDDIEYTVTGIGENVFQGSGVTSITIPATLEYIKYDSFLSEGSRFTLERINISNLKAWCEIDFKSNPLSCAKHLYLNGELVAGNLVLPDGLTLISENAFNGCADIQSIVIPEGTVSINHYAFYNCMNLSKVYLPASLTRIEYGNFDFNKDLFPNANPVELHFIDLNQFFNIDEINTKYRLFVNETEINEIVFPNTMETIQRVWGNCVSVSSVTIPNSVTSIGNNVFYGWPNLTDVYIGNGLVNIDDSAFGNNINFHLSSLQQWCEMTKGNGFARNYHLYIGETMVSDAVIPEGTTRINDGCFSGWADITSVTIPNSVTFIGDRAFYYWKFDTEND